MLQKLSQIELQELLQKFCAKALAISQLKIRQIILFGSYARGEAADESDVDIMILTDASREDIPSLRKYLVELSTDLGWEYDPPVSPTMQNYDFFMDWAEVLPFYRNVIREGIELYAA